MGLSAVFSLRISMGWDLDVRFSWQVLSPTGGFPASADAPLVKISDAVFFYKSLNIKIEPAQYLLYCALLWIQGKTPPLKASFQFRLYCALFCRSQGKTNGDERTGAGFNCTVPYFGFKAKLTAQDCPQKRHCTVPYFGFKAKQDRVVFLVFL